MGGNKSRGYEYAGSSTVGDVAWYDSNSGSKTQEVGKKAPNELGLYDMSGNLWEWCSDWLETTPVLHRRIHTTALVPVGCFAVAVGTAECLSYG
ncbi:formylglycine-generating enzyme family protein [Mesotoga sp. UBA5847]|jgi:formylglycine-generating enzyme required for sulfatase activity|uniref:formylglycine-generating enzyme family protein n=1 Tax=Mesotoga sp. UBA5847 TaxID=1946859 RepID=UPI0025E55661|nr:SUMF1/EgtB/PvdO family nonheme iron enzyme [Mesotoga sp. UBA5847]